MFPRLADLVVERLRQPTSKGCPTPAKSYFEPPNHRSSLLIWRRCCAIDG
jgi:hypothetical protein